jgi:hypothetical protein
LLRFNWRVAKVFLLLAAVSAPAAQAMHLHRKPTSGHAKKVSGKVTKHGTKLHGQQNIDPERAKQIQTALVREHYMTGEPTGTWDDASKEAMTRYQADHGWQTKVTPDSRALIKLGLGPEQTGAAPVASTASQTTHAANGTTLPTTAQSHTLGSAISAHSNTQNLVQP